VTFFHAYTVLYYSSYYLAGAFLFIKNIKAETHNGVKTQLFKNYVKTGSLSLEHGKLYSHLFDWRQESDYADFVILLVNFAGWNLLKEKSFFMMTTLWFFILDKH